MSNTQTARPALRFLSADAATGIVAFAVASKHNADRMNVVSLDTITSHVSCNCSAAQFGRTCWHSASAQESWAAELATQGLAWMTDAQLLRYGRKARLCVDTYEARTGRSRIEDRVALLAARGEYRRRVRLGLIERESVMSVAA